VVGLAGVAAAAGGARRAARLLGAAAALLATAGLLQPTPGWRDDHARATAAARAQVDEQTFAAAWAEGRAMPLEQAVAYALEEAAGERAGAGEPATEAGAVRLG
jgi:hypothetical protein